MDDRNVREGINDEESNVSKVGFVKCHLMDVYGMLATYCIGPDSVSLQIYFQNLDYSCFVVDFIKTVDVFPVSSASRHNIL